MRLRFIPFSCLEAGDGIRVGATIGARNERTATSTGGTERLSGLAPVGAATAAMLCLKSIAAIAAPTAGLRSFRAHRWRALRFGHEPCPPQNHAAVAARIGRARRGGRRPL